MNTNFSRTLSLLRKEKNLSQKNAAAYLKISQALLSHYENGVREPGLSFVVDAADFYGVSVDFLLGRTMSRDGTAINVNDLHDAASDKDNILRGSAMSLVSKKIVVNAVGILFDLLGRMENRALVQHAYSYLGTCIYKLFRYVYMKNGKTTEAFFAVPSKQFPDSSDACIKLSEMRFKTELDGQEDAITMTNDSLTRDYPLLIQSLLSMVHASEKEINKLM
jgi:transcriptional regulator with XRE-family HTH domain